MHKDQSSHYVAGRYFCDLPEAKIDGVATCRGRWQNVAKV